MSIEKDSSSLGKYFQKSLNGAFFSPISKSEEQKNENAVWMEKIHIKGSSSKKVHGEMASQKSHSYRAALDVLFPGAIRKEMRAILEMPEGSLEEKMAKEMAFRMLISREYHILEVMPDSHSGLRAIIKGTNPEIDSNSEKITAIILRGDIIAHATSHQEHYPWIMDHEMLKKYCFEIANPESPIGFKEMEIMSDILKTPIHIFCYEDACISDKGEIMPGNKALFGKKYENGAPISLYFDPLENHYFSLKKAPS